MKEQEKWQKIIALRMERQHLIKPADRKEYDLLYRDCQPGQSEYWHGFGQPPLLSYRADFDDTAYNRQRQAEHLLAKGRFQGGNLGWILSDEMELWACLSRKSLEHPTIEQAQLLELIRREGPLNIQQIKEETGLLVKQITPILHRLQEAFLIYEDQYDGEWDRGWYRFEELFPEVDPERYSRIEALKILLQRFTYRMVYIDADMVKSFYRLPGKDCKTALTELEAEGILVPWHKGYLGKEDADCLESFAAKQIEKPLILHRNDMLVKAFEAQLKKQFSAGDYETLFYILLDGEIHGAVMGKFKYGPYIIEDVVVEEAYTDRREEILEAVQQAQSESRIKRFNGMELPVIESRCGILCSRCKYRESMNCQGCAAIAKPFWGECPVKSCCEGKQQAHCGSCREFPCKQLHDFAYDAQEGDNGLRLEQCRRWADTTNS